MLQMYHSLPGELIFYFLFSQSFCNPYAWFLFQYLSFCIVLMVLFPVHVPVVFLYFTLDVDK